MLFVFGPLKPELNKLLFFIRKKKNIDSSAYHLHENGTLALLLSSLLTADRDLSVSKTT
jgi:hypothetical protein